MFVLLSVLAFAQTVGADFVATGHRLRPAGDVVTFPGRPVDLALAGKHVVLKDDAGLVFLDAVTWKVVQRLPFPRGKGGGSMHGLAVHAGRAFATTSGSSLCEAERSDDGVWAWKRTIDI